MRRVDRRGLALVTLGVTVLVVFTLRRLLFATADTLPGTDAGNLYAWELYTRAGLSAGRIPHWNPYLFSGTPHFADTETTVLYPPAMMLRWLPPALFLSWMAALHMVIGGVGGAFLSRVLGLRWPAAAAAAVALTLGGSVPGWIYNGHLLLLYTTAWLPWVLALTIKSAQSGTAWPHPGLVIVLILQFLAGYVQGSIYIIAAAAACVAWLVVWPPGRAGGRARWVPAVQMAAAGALAAGIVAFQLLPMLLLVSESGRTSGLAYSAAVRGGWSVADLATFFFPFRNIPGDNAMRFMGDHTAYVGWVLAVLAGGAFLNRAHRRAAMFFGALAVFTLALVMAETLPMYRLHFALLPGLRIPGRLLFVVTLCVAMLGAIGLDALAGALQTRRRLMPLIVALLVVLVTIDLSAYAAGAPNPTSAAPAPAAFAIPDGPGRTLSLCDRALSAMDLLIRRRPAADGAGGVFLHNYATFRELAQEDGPVRVRRDLLDMMNVTHTVACEPLEEHGFVRVASAVPGSVFRNESAWPRALWTCGAEYVSNREAVEHLRRVRYDSARRLDRRYFVNIRWAGVVDDSTRRSLETRYRLADGVAGDGRTWRYDLQDRSAANVEALVSDPAVEDTHGIDRQAHQVLAGADTGPGQLLFGTRTCDSAGAVTVIRADQPGGEVVMSTDAPTDGLVFLSEPFYPERVAYVDGMEVPPVRANVAFMAVPVPAGRHAIEIRYVPRRFQLGLAVTILTLLGCLVAAARRSRTSRVAFNT